MVQVDDLLATVEDLNELLEPELPEPAARLLLQIATAVVQGVVAQHLLRVDGDELTMDLHHATTDAYLDLPEHPVNAVHQVWLITRHGRAEQFHPVTDYVPQLTAGRLWRRDGWLTTHGCAEAQPTAVRVLYDHGYPPGHPKLTLARSVVLMLAAAAARRTPGGRTSPPGVSSERIGDYQISYSEGDGSEVADVMNLDLNAGGFVATALRRTYARSRTRSLRLYNPGP